MANNRKTEYNNNINTHDLEKGFKVGTKKASKRLEKKADKRVERVKRYRREVSRKASMANKRLDRLSKAGLENSPAYQQWLASGGEKFSVRGKSYNEVQQEMARLNKFLDQTTSTVTGTKKVLKNMIDVTGMDINWSDWKDLQKKTAEYFNLASKIEQYLRSVEDVASAIGYNKIWEAINKYISTGKKSLTGSDYDVEKATKEIVQSMKLWETSDTAEYGNKRTGGWLELEFWLPKDK